MVLDKVHEWYALLAWAIAISCRRSGMFVHRELELWKNTELHVNVRDSHERLIMLLAL